MNRSRRFELWMSGVLVVVCLLLLNGLVRQLRSGSRRKLVSADLSRSVSGAQHPAGSFRKYQELDRVERGADSTPATRRRYQPRARGAGHPLQAEQAKPTVLFQFPEAKPQGIAPPQPKTITLEPLGYAQKADGRVEAIISLGERVQVVHEGEILEDKFRVAKLSASSVELVEKSATAAEVQLKAEAREGLGLASTGKAAQKNFLPVPEQVSNINAARQFAAASAAGGSQPSVRQELGYVERADGRVEAIIAEGEHVRLAQAPRSFASTFRVSAPSPANLEVANALPPLINPADSLGHESQPIQTNASTQEADEPPLVALGSEPPAADKPQGVPAGHEESETEPPGIVQPEPLADYSRSRFEPREAAPTLSPAGAQTSRGITPPLAPDVRVTQSAVKPLGYVEKAGGEKEAIVEVLGQVYLVHEGELFAEKYRALQVTPSSVKIVEESTKGSSVPAEPKPDPKAIRPPISRWRAPPLSRGSPVPAEPKRDSRAVRPPVSGWCAPPHLQGSSGTDPPCESP